MKKNLLLILCIILFISGIVYIVINPNKQENKTPPKKTEIAMEEEIEKETNSLAGKKYYSNTICVNFIDDKTGQYEFSGGHKAKFEYNENEIITDMEKTNYRITGDMLTIGGAVYFTDKESIFPLNDMEGRTYECGKTVFKFIDDDRLIWDEGSKQNLYKWSYADGFLTLRSMSGEQSLVLPCYLYENEQISWMILAYRSEHDYVFKEVLE